MLIAISFITVYTTLSQQQTHIERELNKQVQIKDLLTQAIAGQYYSAINLYLTNSINARHELINRSKFIEDYLKALYANNHDLDVKQILMQFKSIYNGMGIDLLAATGDKFLIYSNFDDLTEARSLNNSSINELLLHSSVGSDGAFVSFFTPQIKKKDNLELAHLAALEQIRGIDSSILENDRNSAEEDSTVNYFGATNQQNRYLIFAFNIHLDRNYRLALVHDINYLYTDYHSSENVILQQLKDSVYSINVSSTMLGDAFILDAKNYQMLLSTADQKDLEMYGFNRRIASRQLITPIIQDYEIQKSLNKALRIQQLDKQLQKLSEQPNQTTSDLTTPTTISLDPLSDEEAMQQNSLALKINDQKYYVTYTFFAPLKWYIVLITKESLIVAPAYKQAVISLSIGLGVLVLTLIVCLVFSQFLTRRLTIIADKAQKISEANLSDPSMIKKITASLNSSGQDEVSKINQALISMGNSLSTNLQNLFTAIRQTSTMESELNMAHQIQQGMLVPPDELIKTPYNEIMAMMSPAKAVGGDFYDAFAVDDDNIAFIIGDVSDKGVPAALFMSMTMHLAKSCLLLKYSPAESCEFINNRLSERNPNMMFVTLCIGIINIKTGTYTICNAGHCLPIVVADSGIVELPQICGPAVGPISDMPYSEYQGTLEENCSIFLYTDGVSEAQNEQGEFFGVSRLLDILGLHTHDSPAALVDTVYKAILKFRQQANQSDDITMLCLKRISPK